MMPFSKLGLPLLVGMVVLCSSAITLAVEDLPGTWSELEEAVGTLLEQDAFDDALNVIEKTAPELNGRDFEISDLTMTILFAAGRADEALTVWEKGLDEGYFYFVIPRLETYDAVRGSDRFRSALARNNDLRDSANRGSKPVSEVITPPDYSPDGSYPLLMIIHGGNQSNVKAKGRWDSRVAGDDHIVAYVQSSRQAATGSYRWDLNGIDIYSRPTAQDEVLGLYQEIVAEYAVDTTQVILAGFSQGGNLSLTLAAEGTIPAKGFIAGCPAIRSPISTETAEVAAARGVRGTIFVGSEDWTAAPAQTSVTHFQEAGVAIELLVMDGKGHEFPDDFEEVLREAIGFIHR